jgi:hypothetical protein
MTAANQPQPMVALSAIPQSPSQPIADWGGTGWLAPRAGFIKPSIRIVPLLISSALLTVLFLGVGWLYLSAARTAAVNGSATYVYQDPDGHYNVTFRGQPTYTVTPASGNIPIPFKTAEYVAIGGIDEFVIVYESQTGTHWDLKKGFDGLTQGASGAVVSSNSGTFQSYPSLEGVASTSSGFMQCRLIEASPGMYVVCASGPTNPAPDFASFSASFKLTGK